MLAGTWCSVLGHGHVQWVEAIQDQVSRLTHVGPSFSATKETNEALAKLRAVLPPELSRVVLLNTGSEAVELALKMAHAATGRDKVAVFEGGYYGATTYALTLSEAGRTASYLPRRGEIQRLPAPTCRRCPVGSSWPCSDFGCLDDLRALAKDSEQRLAAVVYEPVMAGRGIVVPPPGHGAMIRDLASRCGALLISEEVTTGVGRTGRWFGFQHDGIVPDILVLGKALGAGFPVSAVVTTAEVEARCRSTLRHVQSHQNDPLSGRIVATVISILQENHLVEAAAERGAALLDGLTTLGARVSRIRDVRGKGLMLGVELERDRAAEGMTKRRRLLEAGVIVDYQPETATFRLFPPYVLSAEEASRFLDVFEQAMKD
jgi:4-aminobutyrate aminotransferase-like enzyme